MHMQKSMRSPRVPLNRASHSWGGIHPTIFLQTRWQRTARCGLLTSVIVCVAMLVLAGCQSPQLRLNASQRAIAGELTGIDPRRDPLPAATPIIDVHTHTFNARYLPLEGILHGKRDALFPVTTLISDHCAKVIAEALIDRTELSAIPGQPGIMRKPDTEELRATRQPGFLCNIFLGLIDKAIAGGAWKQGVRTADKMRTLDSIAERMNVLERLAVKSAASMMGMEAHTRGSKTVEGTISGVQAAVRFLWTLTQNDARMAALFREMHGDVPKKGSITMVSHMMDLGPVYDQCPDGKALLDFQTQQVRRMESYQNQPGSGLLYFVAYNPYRDHLQGCSSSGALDLVKDAITRHGARGVKIYPPSGYRAAGNEIPPRPLALFTHFPSQQWEARYGRLGSEPNKALDQELNGLLEWCIAKDVPVFVHSGYGEFEARKGYGVRNSDPRYWEQFLVSHSKQGQPCKLRLCLGHAGGPDFWFGSGSHADWGRKAYELCTQYPNVYCEITTDDPMIRPDTQAFFVDRVATLFKESEHPQDSGARYLFAKKLMYGTDWYLPDKGKPADVLLATQKAFLDQRLRPHYADYFSGNARRYLKLASGETKP